MPHNKKEAGSGVILFLIAVALYVGSYAIVVTTNDATGPQFFPRTVVICIGILAVAWVASSPKRERKEQGSGERGGFNIKAAATVGILFTYALLVQTIGLITMTAVYLLVQILLFLPEKRLRSGRGTLVTAAVLAATSILIYGLLYRAFSIFLPTGLLG